MRSLIYIFALSFISLLPSHAMAQRRALCVHGLEAGQHLSVRAGPSRQDAIIGRFPAKACNVRLVGGCSDGWCVMALGAVKGFVDTRYIGVYELPSSRTADAPPTRSGPRLVEQGSAASGACVSRVDWWDTLRIRSGPGTANTAIGEIPPGACGVGLTGACRGPWCRIAWRGRSGWVNTYYLD